MTSAATTTAKTPTVSVARVLRGLGLKQGKDFSCKGEYRGRGLDRERVGTYVVIYNRDAEQVVADNADAIEQRTQQDGGFSFRVSIHRTPSGGFWTHIANFGQRVREGHVLDTDADRKRMGLDEPQADAATRPVIKAKLGTPRPAFPLLDAEKEDPYAGKAQRRMGALYWACEEADQVWFFQDGYHGARYTLRVYRGRARATGWLLSGPGLPVEGRWMGPTLTLAAEASESVIMDHKWITERMADVARAWPKGTRVTNGHRTGAVNGVAWGVVTAEGHENYGRAWADVDWDAVEGDMGANRRGRPFADTLTRI